MIANRKKDTGNESNLTFNRDRTRSANSSKKVSLSPEAVDIDADIRGQGSILTKVRTSKNFGQNLAPDSVAIASVKRDSSARLQASATNSTAMGSDATSG